MEFGDGGRGMMANGYRSRADRGDDCTTTFLKQSLSCTPSVGALCWMWSVFQTAVKQKEPWDLVLDRKPKRNGSQIPDSLLPPLFQHLSSRRSLWTWPHLHRASRLSPCFTLLLPGFAWSADGALWEALQFGNQQKRGPWNGPVRDIWSEGRKEGKPSLSAVGWAVFLKREVLILGAC